jgi:aspartate kinase
MEVWEMNVVVQKYGGTSVATPERIKNVAQRIKKKVDEGYKVVVVVSAMGKTTDNLIKLAKEISPRPDSRELDMLLATGEQVSAALLSMALKDLGVKAKSLNAFQVKIKTTPHHTSARIVDIDDSVIWENLKNYDVLVVTGFQGVNEHGDLTTLGRGGSDTSAVALAAKLRVPCEIYSDVDGIYTCDPRVHPRAKKLAYITYDEALELTALGAKVLHSRSVEIAKKYGIPIYCASSFTEEEGTMDVEGWKSTYEGGFAKLSIVGVGMRTSPGVAARFFEALERAGVTPELVTTSEIKISCLVPEEKAEEALKSVIEEFEL